MLVRILIYGYIILLWFWSALGSRRLRAAENF